MIQYDVSSFPIEKKNHIAKWLTNLGYWNIKNSTIVVTFELAEDQISR